MQKPWYKQFWPWFLIFLPMCAVVGSFVTLGLFTKNSVDLVSENYYQEGKGINVDLTKIHVAKGFKLNASVVSTPEGITFKLDKGKLPLYPALKVKFTHRTLPDRDFEKTLSSDANGNYRLNLDTPLQGPWFIKLEPHNQEWIIQGKVTFPTKTPTVLLD
ncbi:FixH family protein [Vibrio rumoiensis]|uniref:FixH family protein n=1 Tax=Vibrio rumoiensis TaxID=76258 RepID=A0ABW7IXU5_9VIBR|nr:FixH family protein [Vibrio rumoiensis]